jgi:hypothetical protein
MIDNIQRLNELAGLARKRKLAYVTKTVTKKQLEESSNDGWEVIAKNKTTVRLSKVKDPLVALEDRWWTLLYRLQFTHISGLTGSNLQTNSRSASPISVALGTIGLNNQVALITRCTANAVKRNQIENFIDCQRRLNIEPPCRSNIEPGRVAGFLDWQLWISVPSRCFLEFSCLGGFESETAKGKGAQGEARSGFPLCAPFRRARLVALLPCFLCVPAPWP